MTTTIEIPTLETERLRLRAPVLADWEAVARFLGDERTRFMGGPYGRDDAWTYFAASIGAWVLQGYGYWAVERRDDGRLVGAVGLQKPASFPEEEFGWDLYKGQEGHGYATEAALAARDWALGPRGLTTLASYIHPENARSIRVAERLGAVLDSVCPRPDPEDLVYRHGRTLGASV